MKYNNSRSSTSTDTDIKTYFTVKKEGELEFLLKDRFEYKPIVYHNRDEITSYYVNIIDSTNMLKIAPEYEKRVKPIKIGDRITVIRNTPDKNQHSFYSRETLSADSLNTAFDQVGSRLEELTESSSVSIKENPDTIPNSDLSLPSEKERGGKILGFTDDGKALKAFISYDTSGLPAEMAEMKKDINDNKQSSDSNTVSIDYHTQVLSTLKPQVDKAVQDANKAIQDVATVKPQVDKAVQDVADLKPQVDKAVQDSSQAVQDVTNLKAQVADNDQNIKSNGKAVDDNKLLLDDHTKSIADNKASTDANTVELATLKPQVDKAVQDVADMKTQADADRENINLNGKAVDENKVLIDTINTKDTTFTGVKTITDGLVLPFIHPWGTNLSPNDLTPTGVNKDGKLVHYYEDNLSGLNEPVVKLPATLDGEPMYKMIRKLQLPEGSKSHLFDLGSKAMFILDYSMMVYLRDHRNPYATILDIKRPWELERYKLSCSLQMDARNVPGIDVRDDNADNRYKGFYVMLTMTYVKGSPPTIV